MEWETLIGTVKINYLTGMPVPRQHYMGRILNTIYIFKQSQTVQGREIKKERHLYQPKNKRNLSNKLPWDG